ncbi:MAG: hypothetical protein ACE5E9_13385 [Nitrospinaceae bacterium]
MNNILPPLIFSFLFFSCGWVSFARAQIQEEPVIEENFPGEAEVLDPLHGDSQEPIPHTGRRENGGASSELEPRDPESHFNLALNLWKKKDFDGAIRHLRDTLTLQPENEAAHWNLALLFDIRHEAEEAIIHMKKAEQLFIKKEDVKGVANARKKLRQYYQKYGYQPADFKLGGGFWDFLK